MKKLGFGFMRLPLDDVNDQRTINHAAACDMIDRFMQSGFTYFDTATPYHSGASEIALGKALVARYPREAYTLTTKLSFFALKEKAEIPAFFEGHFKNLGVDYLDYYLLHGLDAKVYETAKQWDAFSFVQQKKAEGRIRHIGFSFHDRAEVLDKILTEHPEMEYVQLQINYIDWEDAEIQSRKCYEVATKHGKPVIVMEPVKGGALASLPEAADKLLKKHAPEASVASWAIRFAASLPNVMMVLSGMSTPEQVADNCAYMQNLQPLNEEEQRIITQAADLIRQSIKVGCTGCRYCVDECPQKIAIPECFELYNDVSLYGDIRLPRAKMHYAGLLKSNGAADSCIACSLCESHCPQHLPIRALLKEVAAMLQ